MSNREISDFLNSKQLKTPKGNRYYPNLIWGALKKYNNRLKGSCKEYLVFLQLSSL